MINQLYIGLMSGTSIDGIDAALVSFENETVELIGTTSIPIPEKIKSALKILSHGENIHIKLLGETDTQMGNLFADAVLDLLQKTNTDAKNIIAIGSHGQTIYHDPNSNNPFTLQIGDANIIAARTNITTVADFRRRDIAHGGQGAPLVPAFHDYLFRNRTTDQIIINIGGIANITYLPIKKSIIGFDTGPGNTLLDLWCEKNCGKLFDQNGEWARSGKLNSDLLNIFLDDDYFKKSFPKSTGKEYFNLHWLEKKLSKFKKNISPKDVQNTLTELTAKTIAAAVLHIHAQVHTIYICGGGAFNLFLMERLRAHLPNTTIHTTKKIGIDPKWMEAIAFAWLAKQTIEKKSGNCPSVTGAKQKSILGAVYFT